MIEVLAVFLILWSVTFAFGFALGYEVGRWKRN